MYVGLLQVHGLVYRKNVVSKMNLLVMSKNVENMDKAEGLCIVVSFLINKLLKEEAICIFVWDNTMMVLSNVFQSTEILFRYEADRL